MDRGPSTTRAGDGVACPYCGSTRTRLERERGPGLCRTVHYCEECSQPFEAFG